MDYSGEYVEVAKSVCIKPEAVAQYGAAQSKRLVGFFFQVKGHYGPFGVKKCNKTSKRQKDFVLL